MCYVFTLINWCLMGYARMSNSGTESFTTMTDSSSRRLRSPRLATMTFESCNIRRAISLKNSEELVRTENRTLH